MQHEQEELIWKYIDGECSEAEKKAVEAQLAADPAFRSACECCQTVHAELAAMQPEQPSMRFNAVVLERVFNSLPAKAAQELLSKSFIRWVGGIGSALIAVLGWTFTQFAPASQGQSHGAYGLLGYLDELLAEIPYSTLLMITLISAVLAILYGLDGGLRYLRRRWGA